MKSLEKRFTPEEKELVAANDNEKAELKPIEKIESGDVDGGSESTIGEHLTPESREALMKLGDDLSGEASIVEESESNNENEFDLTQPEVLEGVASYAERIKAQALTYAEENESSKLNKEQQEALNYVLGSAEDIIRFVNEEALPLAQGEITEGSISVDDVEEAIKKLEEDFKSFYRTLPEPDAEPSEKEEPEVERAEPEIEDDPEEAKIYPITVYEKPEEVTATVVDELIIPSDSENLPALLTQYEQLRLQWLEAKDFQETAIVEYHKLCQEHYDGLQEETGFAKLKNKLKATFGHKENLSPEIQEKRAEMFKITAEYNRLSRQMMAAREEVNKEKASPEAEGNELVTEEQSKRQDVLERYQKMYARATIVRMFEGEAEIRNQAAEEMKIKPPAFIRKHPKVTRFLGGALIGGFTGGITGLIHGIARAGAGALGGSALSGLASTFVGKHYDKKIDTILEGEYKDTIAEIGKKLTSDGLSPEEFEESYGYLAEIYHKVDKEEQKRILAIIGTAATVGALTGMGVGYGLDELSDAGVTVGGVVDGAKEVASDAGEVLYGAAARAGEAEIIMAGGNIMESSIAGADVGDASSATGAELSPALDSDIAPSIEALPTAYVAQPEDNLWNIMEGETSVGKVPAFENVAPEHQQALIDLTRDELNENDLLRAEVGFGDTASDLAEGAEVNVAKINEIAAGIAEEKGWLIGSEGVVLTEEIPTGADVDAANAEAVAAEVESELADETRSSEDELSTGTEAALAASAIEEVAVNDNVLPVETAPVVEAANDNMPVPSDIYETIRDTFNGDYMKFDQSFQSDFVSKIEEVGATKGGGFFGGGEPYMSAYHHFESMNMEQFLELKEFPPVKLDEYLDLHDVNPKDYEAWSKVVTELKESSVVDFGPHDRFEEVIKSAYVRDLLEAKQEAA